MWTAKPTDDYSEILLGRIDKILLKRGILNPRLVIHYGDGIKRQFVVAGMKRQSAKDFFEAYKDLSKPMLTDEEIQISSLAEAAHREEMKSRMIWAISIIAVLVILVLLINFGG
jgi:hypothetical protein